MKVYAAIGHWKGSENVTSVAEQQLSKRDFLRDLRGNEFVPYVVITEGMMKRLVALTNEDFVQLRQTSEAAVSDRSVPRCWRSSGCPAPRTPPAGRSFGWWL